MFGGEVERNMWLVKKGGRIIKLVEILNIHIVCVSLHALLFTASFSKKKKKKKVHLYIFGKQKGT